MHAAVTIKRVREVNAFLHDVTNSTSLPARQPKEFVLTKPTAKSKYN